MQGRPVGYGAQPHAAREGTAEAPTERIHGYVVFFVTKLDGLCVLEDAAVAIAHGEKVCDSSTNEEDTSWAMGILVNMMKNDK